MPLLRLSLMDGQRVVDSVNGQEITLTALVEGLTYSGSDPDPTVLTRCAPILPPLYSPHYDTANFPYATLRDRHIIARRSFTSALIALIYRAPGAAEFTLEDINQSEYRKTAVTAAAWSAALESVPGAVQNIEAWFDKNGDNTAITIPSTIAVGNMHRIALDVPRAYGNRIMRATGWMPYAAWEAVSYQIHTAVRCTNSSPWGVTDADDTGCWLFQGLTTRTRDFNITKEIELYFIQDPDGHYPSVQWIDELGYHEVGGVTPNQILAKGPPPVVGYDALAGMVRTFRGQWQMNGITRAAVYPEVDFNALFTFDPSDT